MAATRSAITMKICSSKGKCCNAFRLEDPKEPDFRRNGVNHYDGNEIGGCYKFPMNAVKEVYLTVNGSDNWLGRAVWVYLRDGRKSVPYRCEINGIYGWIVNHETKKVTCYKF